MIKLKSLLNEDIRIQEELIPLGNILGPAKKKAKEISAKNPKLYYTIHAAFGLFLHASKKLHVNAPTDSIGGIYFKAGKEKPFSDKQKVRDSMNTPTMH